MATIAAAFRVALRHHQAGELPAAERLYRRFSKPTRITPQVVASWAEILRRVPNARLILKYRGLDDRGTSRRFLQSFAEHQAASARIELRGFSPYVQMLVARGS